MKDIAKQLELLVFGEGMPSCQCFNTRT